MIKLKKFVLPKVKLSSILSTSFLVVSLITAVSVTANINLPQLIGSFAKGKTCEDYGSPQKRKQCRLGTTGNVVKGLYGPQGLTADQVSALADFASGKNPQIDPAVAQQACGSATCTHTEAIDYLKSANVNTATVEQTYTQNSQVLTTEQSGIVAEFAVLANPYSHGSNGCNPGTPNCTLDDNVVQICQKIGNQIGFTGSCSVNTHDFAILALQKNGTAPDVVSGIQQTFQNQKQAELDKYNQNLALLHVATNQNATQAEIDHVTQICKKDQGNCANLAGYSLNLLHSENPDFGKIADETIKSKAVPVAPPQTAPTSEIPHGVNTSATTANTTNTQTAPVPSPKLISGIVSIWTSNATNCQLAANGKFFAFLNVNGPNCILSVTNLAGITTQDVFNQIANQQIPGTVPSTKPQCDSFAVNGIKTTYENGLCVVYPKGVSAPGSQQAAAPAVQVPAPALIANQQALNKSDYSDLMDFLATGDTSQDTVLQICKKVFSDCTSTNLPQFAAQEISGNGDPNTASQLLAKYNQRIAQPPVAEAPAPAAQPSSNNAGDYSQHDPNYKDIVIPNTVDPQHPDGHTIENLGCGVIAVTNILDKYGYKYSPQDVLDMIRPEDWTHIGISGESGGDFLLLLSQTSQKKYNKNAPDFGFSVEPANWNSGNYWGRMHSDQVLWIGSNAVSGTEGQNVPHITYMTPTDTPNTFKLQTNDYFGSNLDCSGGTTSKGDGFNCYDHNDINKKTVVEIPIDISQDAPQNIMGGQAVYLITPPGN